MNAELDCDWIMSNISGAPPSCPNHQQNEKQIVEIILGAVKLYERKRIIIVVLLKECQCFSQFAFGYAAFTCCV